MEHEANQVEYFPEMTRPAGPARDEIKNSSSVNFFFVNFDKLPEVLRKP